MASATQCGSDWSKGTLLLVDTDNNGTLSADEPVLARFHWQQTFSGEAIALSGTLQWRAFGNRQRLLLSELGELADQNGSLTWCPPAASAASPHQLVINASGRIRLAADHDGDGWREDSQGAPLRC